MVEVQWITISNKDFNSNFVILTKFRVRILKNHHCNFVLSTLQAFVWTFEILLDICIVQNDLCTRTLNQLFPINHGYEMMRYDSVGLTWLQVNNQRNRNKEPVEKMLQSSQMFSKTYYLVILKRLGEEIS